MITRSAPDFHSKSPGDDHRSCFQASIAALSWPRATPSSTNLQLPPCSWSHESRHLRPFAKHIRKGLRGLPGLRSEASNRDDSDTAEESNRRCGADSRRSGVGREDSLGLSMFGE